MEPSVAEVYWRNRGNDTKSMCRVALTVDLASLGSKTTGEVKFVIGPQGGVYIASPRIHKMLDNQHARKLLNLSGCFVGYLYE